MIRMAGLSRNNVKEAKRKTEKYGGKIYGGPRGNT